MNQFTFSKQYRSALDPQDDMLSCHNGCISIIHACANTDGIVMVPFFKPSGSLHETLHGIT